MANKFLTLSILALEVKRLMEKEGIAPVTVELIEHGEETVLKMHSTDRLVCCAMKIPLKDFQLSLTDFSQPYLIPAARQCAYQFHA